MNEIKIQYNQDTFMQMIEWVLEHHNINSYRMILTEHTKKNNEGFDIFVFEKEEDAIMFKMTWG